MHLKLKCFFHVLQQRNPGQEDFWREWDQFTRNRVTSLCKFAWNSFETFPSDNKKAVVLSNFWKLLGTFWFVEAYRSAHVDKTGKQARLNADQTLVCISLAEEMQCWHYQVILQRYMRYFRFVNKTKIQYWIVSWTSFVLNAEVIVLVFSLWCG